MNGNTEIHFGAAQPQEASEMASGAFGTQIQESGLPALLNYRNASLNGIGVKRCGHWERDANNV